MKLISLNIEGSAHYDKILPFFKKESPDILLLQEVFEADINLFVQNLKMEYIFTPMTKKMLPSQALGVWGIAIFSKYPLEGLQRDYYYLSQDSICEYQRKPELVAKALLSASVRIDTKSYRVINTHFTWTPDGKPTTLQYETLESLLRLLKQFPEFILGGDFNAPRGGPIYQKLASLYTDNIPSNISTTLDQNLHRCKDLRLVVDGLFTKGGYKVQEISIIDGVSDHCAILAEIV